MLTWTWIELRGGQEEPQNEESQKRLTFHGVLKGKVGRDKKKKKGHKLYNEWKTEEGIEIKRSSRGRVHERQKKIGRKGSQKEGI